MQAARMTSQAQNMPPPANGKRSEFLASEEPDFYEVTKAEWIAEVVSARKSQSRLVADATCLFAQRSASPLQFGEDDAQADLQDWSMEDQITPTKKQKRQPRYGDYSEDVTLRVNHLVRMGNE